MMVCLFPDNCDTVDYQKTADMTDLDLNFISAQ